MSNLFTDDEDDGIIDELQALTNAAPKTLSAPDAPGPDTLGSLVLGVRQGWDVNGQTVIDDARNIVRNSTGDGRTSDDDYAAGKAAGDAVWEEAEKANPITQRLETLAPALDRVATSRNNLLKWRASESAFLADAMSRLNLNTESGRKSLRNLQMQMKVQDERVSGVQRAFEDSIGGEAYTRLDPDRERPVADKLMASGMLGSDAVRRAAEHSTLDSMIFGLADQSGQSFEQVKGNLIGRGVLGEDADLGILTMPRGQDAFTSVFKRESRGVSGKGATSAAQTIDLMLAEKKKAEARVEAFKEAGDLVAANRHQEYADSLIKDASGAARLGGSLDVTKTTAPLRGSTLPDRQAAAYQRYVPTIGRDGFLFPGDEADQETLGIAVGGSRTAYIYAGKDLSTPGSSTFSIYRSTEPGTIFGPAYSPFETPGSKRMTLAEFIQEALQLDLISVKPHTKEPITATSIKHTEAGEDLVNVLNRYIAYSIKGAKNT